MFSKAILLCQSDEIVSRLTSLIAFVDPKLGITVVRDTEEALVELTNHQQGTYILFFESRPADTANLVRFIKLIREKQANIKSVAVIDGPISSGHIEIVRSGTDDYLLFPVADDMQFSILFQSLQRQQTPTKGTEPRTALPASFETLSEIVTEGILQCDLEGKILHCNLKMTEVTGFSKEELVGQSVFLTIIPPHNRSEVQTRYQNRKKGISEEYELEVLKKNGESFWAHLIAKPYRDSRGEVAGVIAALSDFSGTKSASNESNYRRLFLRQVIDTSPNIIYSVNAEGRFSLVNQAFSDLVGIPIKELVGRDIAPFAGLTGSTVEPGKILDIFTHGKQIISRLQVSIDAKPYTVKVIRKELLLPEGRERQVLSIGVTEPYRSNSEIHELHNSLQKICAEAEISLLRKRPDEMEASLEKIVAYTVISDQALQASADPQSVTASTVPDSRKSVLVVDDEEQIVELLSNLLQVSGFIVYGFTSGTEALHWANEHGNDIDAVVLDLKMQAINGTDCLTALKKICPEAPVIILSGFVEPNVETSLLKQGATKFFHKPLRYAQLVACLRDLLGITQAQTANPDDLHGSYDI